ncbi:MAG: DUF1800 family protein [Candidatus Puniceispirillaceae bacterium]
MPDISWDAPLLTGDAYLKTYGEFVYTRREVLRPKFRNDRKAYEDAKEQLAFETGEKYYESLELAVRHHTALHSGAPVFERFWLFWCNHFAITDKDFMPQFTTGPYHREIIRSHMTGSFKALTQAATLSWAMIHNLDNSESVGPNSQRGKWRREKGKPATVNENHARELLELHMLSPEAGYTQKDVIALSYIMAGWRHDWTKKRQECNPVKFDQKSHEPGNHKVLGNSYKQRGITPKNKLLDVIVDLAAHPACAHFIAKKLCRHFICDNPTPEMIAPVAQAFIDSDGDLPTLHKAVVQAVFDHGADYQKFHSPEIWLLQMVNMTGAKWPPSPEMMRYDFKTRPSHIVRMPEKYLKEIGHNPYRPDQPNGWPDTKLEWLSPELLIRRMTFARRFSESRHKPKELDFEAMVEKNFDNADEVMAAVHGASVTRREDRRMQILFPSLWMLMS